MNYIEIIRYARFEQHLSQRALGEKCGLKQQYIYKIEKGKVVPSISVLQKIMSALGYTINYAKFED